MTAAHVRDCFISHASEDKESVARPLAHALKEAGYEVWFDDFELEIGDSLREKIDEGLAGSRFGVVVLSKRFFEKNWTKFELDALVARQMIGDERVILPVWHEIDEEYLESVSPTLASLVGVPSVPLETAVEKIAKRIERRREAGSSGAALVAAQASRPTPFEAEPERLFREHRRVKLSYASGLLSLPEGPFPGWLAVVVGPVNLQDDLIDPTEIPLTDLEELQIENPWRHAPLANRHGLKVGLDGFHYRLPEGEGPPPYYWLKIWQDGLLEFGAALNDPRNDPARFPYIWIAQQIHDYVIFFAKVLEEVGYFGEVVALSTVRGVRGMSVELPPPMNHRQSSIEEDSVDSRTLRAPVREIPNEVQQWTKKTMDRFFLAAGVASGAYFITNEGLVQNRSSAADVEADQLGDSRHG